MEKSHGKFFGMISELTEGYIVYLISLRNSVHLYIKGVHFTNFAFQSPNREIFSRSGENFHLIGRNPPIGRKMPDRDPSRTAYMPGLKNILPLPERTDSFFFLCIFFFFPLTLVGDENHDEKIQKSNN